MTTHEIITLKPQLPVYFDIYRSYDLLVPSHWHSHLEILYILQGTLHISHKKEKYTLKKNDLFIVNSGEIHDTRSIGNAEVLLLQIPYEFLNQSIPQFPVIRFREYFSYEKWKEDPIFCQMLSYLLQMTEYYFRSANGDQFLFSSNLNLFLYHLYTNYSTLQNQLELSAEYRLRTRLRTILEYVEQHYAEPITLSDAAALVALNQEYFCRFFKKQVGCSFIEYVNQVRLTHIYNDLLHTKDNITTLQERHGFTNYKVFNRMFKDVYGCSPSKLKATRQESINDSPST